jgi:hypothetical protein
LGRGLRTRILAKQIILCVSNGVDWKPALLMLAELLKQKIWQGADAVVVVSNQFSRFQLLPGSDVDLNMDEQLILARHIFVKAFGVSAENHKIRISEGGMGKTSVVVGIELDLFDSLLEVFKNASVKIISVQPYLMSAFNSLCRELGRGTQWFVLIEQGFMCVALLHHGEWKSLRVKHISDGWIEELQLILHREQLLSDFTEGVREVCIYMPDIQETTLPTNKDWLLTSLSLPLLPGFSLAETKQYGMALAGII